MEYLDIYDKEGNIYFQIRKDEQKLYTTASGHIKAGKTIKEGFGREIEEEIEFERFLVFKGETATEKYGNALNKVVELTKN